MTGQALVIGWGPCLMKVVLLNIHVVRSLRMCFVYVYLSSITGITRFSETMYLVEIGLVLGIWVQLYYNWIIVATKTSLSLCNCR